MEKPLWLLLMQGKGGSSGGTASSRASSLRGGLGAGPERSSWEW